MGRTGIAKDTLLLSVMGLTNVREEPGVGSAAMGIVLAGFIEAEGTVHRQADLAGIRVFLAVVFPPADGAQAEGVRRFQRFVPAARAAKLSLHQSLHVGIDGAGDVGVYGVGIRAATRE